MFSSPHVCPAHLAWVDSCTSGSDLGKTLSCSASESARKQSLAPPPPLNILLEARDLSLMLGLILGQEHPRSAHGIIHFSTLLDIMCPGSGTSVAKETVGSQGHGVR